MSNIQAKDKQDQAEMSFFDHLEELRWHLIRAVLAIVLFGIVVFLNKQFVFDKVVFGPLSDRFPTYQFFCRLFNSMCEAPEITLQALKVEEKFLTHLKVSIVVGLVIAFPYVFYEIWNFIKPGLYPKERKAARGMVFICSILFSMGVMFGYFVVTPFAFTFLAGYKLGAIQAMPSLSSYVSTMIMIALPAGVVFELPIVVYFLSKIGLVTPAFLKKYRRIAVVVILILSALITPPDITTQFLIGIPLYILYEISIFISARVEKKNNEEYGDE